MQDVCTFSHAQIAKVWFSNISIFKVDCMHYLEAKPWTILPSGLPVKIEFCTNIQAPFFSSKGPASAHNTNEAFFTLAKRKRIYTIFSNRWLSCCTLRSPYTRQVCSKIFIPSSEGFLDYSNRTCRVLNNSTHVLLY